MLNFLAEHFPPQFNYLVRQQIGGEIDSFFKAALYYRTESVHKKELWGKMSQRIPHWGKQLGWVPDHLPLLFLSETVELEIAEAFCSQYGRLNANEGDLSIARSLLTALKLSELSDRNPYFLSEGETKLVWLLSQWAKQPQYLIASNLPTSLSAHRLKTVIEFLTSSEKISTTIGNSNPPILILGCLENQNQWFDGLLLNPKWKLVAKWPELSIGNKS